MTTTNAKIRSRFEKGEPLNDGAPENVTTASPANGASTAVPADSDTHAVTADGTNTIDLSSAEEAGRAVTVMHNGGVNTPTITFDDADFVGTGPADLTDAGDSATVKNVDGTAAGWFVAGSGSA